MGGLFLEASFYRRYRPQLFSQVQGQDTAMFVLSSALTHRTVSHAYLFSGPRGCGKTTLARLLAKALNCERRGDSIEPCGECASCVSITEGSNLDVIEIDGASNNGVDEVRELRSHVSLSPFGSRYKVYIIDEVHMLSLPAFNALLKTLEEPPDRVVFILATTEPQKVPVTIRSRCHHIPFHRISVPDIVAQLGIVCSAESIPAEREALREIARLSDGALRDALSILEQAILLSHGEVTLDSVERLTGGGSRRELERILEEISAGHRGVFSRMEELFRRGASPVQVFETLFLIFRDLWSFHSWGSDAFDSLECSEEERAALEAAGRVISRKQASALMEYCVKLISSARSGMRTDVLSGLFCARVEELFPEEQRETHRDACVSCDDDEPRNVSSLAAEKDVPIRAVEAPESSRPLGVQDTTSGKADWNAFLDILRERELHLFCALLSASVELSPEEGLRIRIPEKRRASFAVCASERNLYSLGGVLADFFGNEGDAFSVFCGNDVVSSEISRTGSRTDNSDVRDPTSFTEENPEPPNLFSAYARTVREKERGTDGEQPEKTDVPDGPLFDGLVSEALRWGGGEVVLVKRTDREDTEQDGLIEE